MIDTNAIIRFFNNESSLEERQQIMSWVNESDEHARQFFRWEEFYHLGKRQATTDIALRRAEKRLFERIEAEEEKPRFGLRIRTWVKYAAAIAVLLAFTGISSWYFIANPQETWVTASTGIGETLELTLPDSSKVWLNEKSELQYPQTFKKDKRALKLDGEAYFEVTKNKHKPFIVEGKAMSVQVLGTKFNFKNTSTCRIAETSLIEGEVKVMGNHEEGGIILSPGQKVELNLVTRQMKVFSTNAALDAIWHDNLIPFKNADLFTIANVLEKVYKVNIILSPDVDKSTTYSGVIKRKDSIEDVLKLLQNTIHLEYKNHQGTIFLSSK